MFKVIDTLRIGENLSATFEGPCTMLKNNSKLRDKNGNIYTVVSVGMMHYNDAKDISKSTTVLLEPCNIARGDILYMNDN